MEIYSFPSSEDLQSRIQRTPSYMRPSDLPHALISVGEIAEDRCDEIIRDFMKIEPYQFHGCDAITREMTPTALWDNHTLDDVIELTHQFNALYWKFDLDPCPGAWMQTYVPGGNYHIHTDSASGQNRKLTAVLLLSDERAYKDGKLTLMAYPEQFIVPRTRGTLVVFPSWVLHRVGVVTAGLRQTINLGFWGPSFK